jgi:hypothetical protein
VTGEIPGRRLAKTDGFEIVEKLCFWIALQEEYGPVDQWTNSVAEFIRPPISRIKCRKVLWAKRSN